jgi:uncharacterized protein (DUF362 family)
MRSSSKTGCNLARRAFLLGAGGLVAAGAGGGLTWLGLKRAGLLHAGDEAARSFTGRSAEVQKPAYAMPGPFPGRVVEVNHPDAVDQHNKIQGRTVHEMMNRGMCELTGADLPQHPEKESVIAVDAWKRFFQPGDVVGIKVNPVGFKQPWMPSRVVSAISNPEVVIEIVNGLKSVGLKAQDIIVFERYANEFRNAGYEALMRTRPLDGVRWYAASSGYDNTQLDVEGFGQGSDRTDRHVVGYDPDSYVHMGFCDPEADGKDDRRFRSHLSMVVAKMVNKFVTIPVLKDHRSAGVTMALKNMSHGMNNNVARSHLPKQTRGGWTSEAAEYGPNQCNTFIPTAVNQELMRQKATLHIMDGLIGVYEGGPGGWNASWGTWRYKSLFFATDPVAMDHVGWDIIDAKRAAEGWRPVAQMGLTYDSDAAKLSARLAVLAAQRPLEGLALGHASSNLLAARGSEAFDRRTPEHVMLAGRIGLGKFAANEIDHRPLAWDPSSKRWRDSKHHA